MRSASPSRSPSKHSPAARREAVAACGFLLPSLLGTGVFVLFPLADALRRSFFTVLGGRFTGLAAYGRVLQNEAFRLAAANTLRFVAVCVPLLLLLSFLVALGLYGVADSHGLIKTSFLLPLAIPTASVVAIWQLVFSRNGVLDGILGAPHSWFASSATFWVLVGTYLWKNCGYNMILWLSGLYAIPEVRYEAAKVDGAGPFQRLIYITLPGLRPYFFTVSALSLVNSFKVFREAYLLGGNYPHESVYLLQHLFNNWFAALDVDKLCAAAVLLALALLAALLLLRLPSGGEEVAP